MNLFRHLIQDEEGYILSAEAVLLGTVSVVGATVGLGAVSKSLNEELIDLAHAFRSLDQSYSIEAQGDCGCGAWTAGSSFKQQDVKKSRKELNEWIEDASRRERHHDSDHKDRDHKDRDHKDRDHSEKDKDKDHDEDSRKRQQDRDFDKDRSDRKRSKDKEKD